MRKASFQLLFLMAENKKPRKAWRVWHKFLGYRKGTDYKDYTELWC